MISAVFNSKKPHEACHLDFLVLLIFIVFPSLTCVSDLSEEARKYSSQQAGAPKVA